MPLGMVRGTVYVNGDEYDGAWYQGVMESARRHGISDFTKEIGFVVREKAKDHLKVTMETIMKAITLATCTEARAP